MTATTSATVNAALTPSRAPSSSEAPSVAAPPPSEAPEVEDVEEVAEEKIERVPFDEAHVPLLVPNPDDFGPRGWDVENFIMLDWDADGLSDVVVQVVESSSDAASDAPGDRARGLVFAHGEGDMLRRVGLGSFLPSTHSGGAMWGDTDMTIDLNSSDDGREVVIHWAVGARDRVGIEMVFAWDRAKGRPRLVRRTNSWFATFDGSQGEKTEDFVAGKLTVSESPADGAPVVKKSRFSPKWIGVEDARAED